MHGCELAHVRDDVYPHILRRLAGICLLDAAHIIFLSSEDLGFILCFGCLLKSP